MNRHDRLIVLWARIERHGIALSAAIILPILGIVWWNQARTNREIAELSTTPLGDTRAEQPAAYSRCSRAG